MKLHSDEVDIDQGLVSKLLVTQFPKWSELKLSRVKSDGTDNAMYRLGDDKLIRLPRIPKAASHIEKEQQWLPKLASKLTTPVPQLQGKGEAADYYPFPWLIYDWLEGEDALSAVITDYDQVARDLAAFLKELHEVDATDAPLAIDFNIRGTPLAKRDEETREAITAVGNMFDTKALTKAWDIALKAAEWSQIPVWIHGDMLPGNILIKDDRINAVIDFSGICIGDPACDLMIAWNLLPPSSREVLRTELEIDDDTWQRGRGHALSQALIFIPYYLKTHPKGVERAKRTINNILAEL